MVDPSHPDQIARLGKVVSIDVHPKRASTLIHTAKALAWTGIVRFVISRGEKPRGFTTADGNQKGLATR